MGQALMSGRASPVDAAEVGEQRDRILTFSDRYQTPLTPEVYAVWFAYCQRKTRGINDKLDRAMNMNEDISKGFLEELYHLYLSPRSLSDELVTIGQTLSTAVSEVSDVMDDNMKDHSSFSSSLRAARQSLVQGSSKREVASIITQLHKINQTHIASAQRMSLQLEKNRNQIAKLEKELAEIKRTTNIDELTGLANRRRLDELMDEALLACQQRRQTMALTILEIDNLDRINADFGREAGDRIIRRLATEIRKVTTGRDFSARLSGSRFGLALPDSDKSRGIAVADTLREVFSKIDWVSKESGNEIGSLSLSVGIVELVSGEQRTSFISRADGALRQALESGGDQIRTD